MIKILITYVLSNCLKVKIDLLELLATKHVKSAQEGYDIIYKEKFMRLSIPNDGGYIDK